MEAGKDVAGFRSIVVVSWYCFFSFFLSFCRLRSLNVAVKLLWLLLDVDAAVVVVNLVAFYTDVVDFVTLAAWRCFLCLLVFAAAVWGFWKFTAYRPSLPASPQWLCCSVSQCLSALSCQLQ